MTTEVCAELARRGLHVAVAESLTGGRLADSFVSIPGVSAVFQGAVVAYATASKETVLAVPGQLLATQGAVAPDVAVAMAHGVRMLFGAEVGLATTGVAGPDSQDGKPPGTVCVALVTENFTNVVTRHFDGDRSEVRDQSVSTAWDLLREYLT